MKNYFFQIITTHPSYPIISHVKDRKHLNSRKFISFFGRSISYLQQIKQTLSITTLFLLIIVNSNDYYYYRNA